MIRLSLIISTRAYDFSAHFHIILTFSLNFKPSSSVSNSRNLETVFLILLWLSIYWEPTIFWELFFTMVYSGESNRPSFHLNGAYSLFWAIYFLNFTIQNILFILTTPFCLSPVSKEDCSFLFSKPTLIPFSFSSLRSCSNIYLLTYCISDFCLHWTRFIFA